MAPYPFAIVGTGWRSEFFLRIAASLPERFTVTGLVSRSAEKREAYAKAWGVPTFASIDEMAERSAARFAVVSVPRTAVVDQIEALTKCNMPILAETPPAADIAGLERVAALVAAGARVEVAEQYFLQPSHTARLNLIASGRIGTPSYAHVAVAHGYHGTSLVRKYLGIGFENATISARAIELPIVKSPDRYRPPETLEIVPSAQTIASFDFGGRVGLFDFTGDQYHGWIRSPRLTIRGERGEISGDEIRYLIDQRSPMFLRFERRDTGHFANLEDYRHDGILAGAEWVYRNPYPEARFSDDEIAVAACLDGMKTYVETGRSFYSFAEAAQDHYLALTMDEAARRGEPITTTTQSWSRPVET
jgi:predicted dehydrogenase